MGKSTWFAMLLGLSVFVAAPALAETMVYPGASCTDGGQGEIEIPFTRGGVRVLPGHNASVSCPIYYRSDDVIQNVWVRVRRGNYFAEVMFTLWVLDSFGNHTGDAAQGRFNADQRNQSVSYRIPLPAAGVSAPFGGYVLVSAVLNAGDELVSIRVDTL